MAKQRYEVINNAIYIIALVIISMLSYDSGYTTGTSDATKNITDQFTADLENVLFEGQYTQIPARTMILFKGLHVLR
jgi:hypothetical protein